MIALTSVCKLEPPRREIWVCDDNPEVHYMEVDRSEKCRVVRYCELCGCEMRREAADEQTKRMEQERADRIGYLDGDAAETGARP